MFMKNKFMNKKKYLWFLIIGIVAFTMETNAVNAADTMFSLKGSGYLYTYNGGYNGKKVSSCSGYSNCTYYKKLCSNSSVSSESTCNDGIEAYCVQKSKKSPGTGLTYTEVPIGGSYSGMSWTQTNALKAGYIINAINSSDYSADQKYIYNYMALNIFVNKKGLGSSNNYSNTVANSYVSAAESQQFCTSSSYSTSPITISSDSDKFFSYSEDYKGNGYYKAKVDLTLASNSNCGEEINYTVTVDNGSIYTDSNLSESSNVGKSVTITGKTSYTFYIKVSSSSINIGEKVTYKISASSTSTYNIARLWKPSNSNKQAVMTLTTTSIPHSTSKNGTVIVPTPDKMNISIKKIDDSGSPLQGAEIDVDIYKDEEAQDKIGSCSISASTSNTTGCSITFEEARTDSTTFDYYWSYIEKSAPTGYALIQSPGLQKFTLGRTNTSYFYTYTNSTSGENKTETTDATKYNATYVSLNDGVCVSDGKVVASGVAESNCVSKKDDKTYYAGTYYKSICASVTTDSEGNKSYISADDSLCSTKNSEDKEEEKKDDETKDTEDNKNNDETITETKTYETVSNVCIETSTYSVNAGVAEDHCVSSGEVYEGTYYPSICASYTTDEDSKIFTDDGSKDNSFCKVTFTKTYVSSDGKSIELTIKNSLNNVTISKQDVTGKEIEGATLKICSKENYNKSGTACEASSTINSEEMSWVSESYSKTWYGIPSGTYYLIETTPPNGYLQTTTAVKFTINDDGTVTSDALDAETNTIVITNNLNTVEISKTDIATSKELPGASIAICSAYKDDDGNYVLALGDGEEECSPVTLASGDVATWVSTEESHKIQGLAPGAYYLVEKIAPDGYDVAESILFIMNEDGTISDAEGKLVSDQKITMGDTKIPENVPTGKALTIILCVLGLCSIGYVLYLVNKKNIEI
jgi:hypothetical protein